MIPVTMTDGPELDALTLAVATNVKAYRLAAGMTQPELADAAGVNKNTIYRLETFQQTVEVATVAKIAEALSAGLQAKGLPPVSGEDLTRIPSAKAKVAPVIDTYRTSPWFQIDKPTVSELAALARPELLTWLGAEADAEAIHYALLALRRRQP
jgi:transcriptional regulator with XRE-family HTH domain